MSSCKAGKQSCAENMTPGPALYPWDGLNLRERQNVHVLPSGYRPGDVDKNTGAPHSFFLPQRLFLS